MRSTRVRSYSIRRSCEQLPPPTMTAMSARSSVPPRTLPSVSKWPAESATFRRSSITGWHTDRTHRQKQPRPYRREGSQRDRSVTNPRRCHKKHDKGTFAFRRHGELSSGCETVLSGTGFAIKPPCALLLKIVSNRLSGFGHARVVDECHATHGHCQAEDAPCPTRRSGANPAHVQQRL